MTPARKKIIYVWQAVYPWDVRVEKVCLALIKNGFDVEILARRGPGQPLHSIEKGISVYRVGTTSTSKLFRFFSLPVSGNPFWKSALKKRVQELKPVMLIARDIPLALTTKSVAEKYSIPWLIDMAEHYPEAMRTWKKYQGNFFGRFLTRTLRLPDLVEKKSVISASGILPVCEDQKERLVQEYGCDPNRIVSILNTPENARIPLEVTHKRNAFCFGYHGVILQDRDLLTVVKAFDIAAEKHPNITFKIAGSGESESDVRDLVAQCKHKDRISMSGRFKPEELVRLYNEVDFGVVCWAVNEFTNNTIANKFFDYAAFGKPILYSETRSMQRLMKKMKYGVGYAGFDVDACAKAMLELVDSDYEALSRAGRKSVLDEFNWDTDVNKMIQFMKSLGVSA